MKRIMKYWIALYLRKRLVVKIQKEHINPELARKWNIVQGIIVTKGRVKVKWGKILRNN